MLSPRQRACKFPSNRLILANIHATAHEKHPAGSVASMHAVFIRMARIIHAIFGDSPLALFDSCWLQCTEHHNRMLAGVKKSKAALIQFIGSNPMESIFE